MNHHLDEAFTPAPDDASKKHCAARNYQPIHKYPPLPAPCAEQISPPLFGGAAREQLQLVVLVIADNRKMVPSVGKSRGKLRRLRKCWFF
jgi:hypothetical protein